MTSIMSGTILFLTIFTSASYAQNSWISLNMHALQEQVQEQFSKEGWIDIDREIDLRNKLQKENKWQNAKVFPARNINLVKAPDIVKIYGKNLFGLSFSEKNTLMLKLFRPHLKTHLNLHPFKFTKTQKKSFKIAGEFELEDFEINVPELWIREEDITNELNKENTCSDENYNSFFKDSVWVILKNINLYSPGKIPLKIKFNLNAAIDNQGKVQANIEKLSDNLFSELKGDSRLDVEQLVLPKIFIRLTENKSGKVSCHEINREKMLNAFFMNRVEELRPKILKALTKVIGIKLKEKINLIVKQKLEAFVIPQEVTKQRSFRPMQKLIQTDNTRYVTKWSELAVKEAPSSWQHVFDSIFSYYLKFSFEELWFKDEYLILGIKQQERVNSREYNLDSSSSIKNVDVGDEFFGIHLDESLIQKAIVYAQSLRIFENELFPKGVSFSSIAPKVVLHEDRIEINALIKVELEKAVPYLGFVVGAIERTFGQNSGTLTIPVKLTTPIKFYKDKDGPYLVIAPKIEWEFTNKSNGLNLEDSSALIKKVWEYLPGIVNKKIAKIKSEVRLDESKLFDYGIQISDLSIQEHLLRIAGELNLEILKSHLDNEKMRKQKELIVIDDLEELLRK